MSKLRDAGATDGEQVDTGRGELRKPDDQYDQPGQGADLTPPIQQQRHESVPSPEELASGDGHHDAADRERLRSSS